MVYLSKRELRSLIALLDQRISICESELDKCSGGIARLIGMEYESHQTIRAKLDKALTYKDKRIGIER